MARNGSDPGHHRRRHRSLHQGFTLIEVLVVVAIIALLISILLPTLRNAREQAKRAVCGSNLRTSGTALHYYTLGNRDYYPVSGQWAERSRPYIQKASVKKDTTIGAPTTGVDMRVEFYKCPSDRIGAVTHELDQKVGGVIVETNYRVSYAFNAFLPFPLMDAAAAKRGVDYRINHEPVDVANDKWRLQRTTTVKRHGDIVMLTDAGDDDLGAGDGPEWAQSMNWDFDEYEDNIDPNLAKNPNDTRGKLEVHHVTGNNFLYADLHVRYDKVQSEGVPRRGVPRFPWHWIPINLKR